MLRWESNYHSVYSDFTNSTIAIVVKRQIHQSIHLRVYNAAFIHLMVQNITSNIIIRTILTTAKDHKNVILWYVRWSCEAVCINKHISNNIITPFPCHIVYLTVHIVIRRSVDSFHSYSTKKIYLKWYH